MGKAQNRLVIDGSENKFKRNIFQASFSAEQEIKWENFSLTPSLSPYYVDSQNKKQIIKENNATLTQ